MWESSLPFGQPPGLHAARALTAPFWRPGDREGRSCAGKTRARYWVAAVAAIAILIITSVPVLPELATPGRTVGAGTAHGIAVTAGVGAAASSAPLVAVTPRTFWSVDLQTNSS